MNAHTVFLLCWCAGMAAAVALAYIGSPMLALVVLVFCAGMRSHEP